MRVIVTRPENVTESDSGEIKLKDEDDIGYLTHTHVVPYMTQNKDGVPTTGVSVLCEVHWELNRTPGVALVAPEDLYWVSFLTDDEVDDEETEEVEEVENNENSFV